MCLRRRSRVGNSCWLMTGSSDSSTAMARHYSTEYPHLVKYLEHDNHCNRGLPASRNLGINNARGEYIALLDSDDVWLPIKLERQIAIMDSHPRVSLVMGASLYWYNWAADSSVPQQDYMQGFGIPANRVYEPPALLKAHLSEVTWAPCPSDLLFRKEVITNLGGFDEAFSTVSGMYEDQAFLAKVFLNLPVYVSDECWDRYRLHRDSICARVKSSGRHPAATVFYLNWVGEYLSSQGAMDAKIQHIIRRRLWPLRHPLLYPFRRWGGRVIRGLKRIGAGLLQA